MRRQFEIGSYSFAQHQNWNKTQHLEKNRQLIRNAAGRSNYYVNAFLERQFKVFLNYNYCL